MCPHDIKVLVQGVVDLVSVLQAADVDEFGF
jgi:hypothetical protein